METKTIITPNGTTVEDLTAEELAERETDIADVKAKVIEETNAKTEKDNLKASAKAKLIAGEALTEEEADTIVL
jgi:phosphoenolpyruvate-protein kinase (PTS system EI component)